MGQFNNVTEWNSIMPRDWDFMSPFADDEPCTDCDDDDEWDDEDDDEWDDEDWSTECETMCYDNNCTMYCDYGTYEYFEEYDCSWNNG